MTHLLKSSACFEPVQSAFMPINFSQFVDMCYACRCLHLWNLFMCRFRSNWIAMTEEMPRLHRHCDREWRVASLPPTRYLNFPVPSLVKKLCDVHWTGMVWSWRYMLSWPCVVCCQYKYFLSTMILCSTCRSWAFRNLRLMNLSSEYDAYGLSWHLYSNQSCNA